MPVEASGRTHVCAAARWAAAAGALVVLWAAFCSWPDNPWNPPRLAPSFALAQGIDIYALRDSGAQLGWVYGPVFVLWNLPAVLAPSLFGSFAVFGLLNVVAICLPVWLVLRDVFGQDRRVAGVSAIFTALLLANDITQGAVFFVHVDAVCVGFATLAAWCLVRVMTPPHRQRFIHGAAACLMLAVWTKQLAAGLVPAMVLWLWVQHRPQLAMRFLLWIVVYGAALALVFFAWFGTEELIFNLWLVGARTPAKIGTAHLAGDAWHLLQATGVWLAALMLGWGGRRRPATGTPAALYRSLLLWMAAASLPFSLLAIHKAGGGLNSLHSQQYFLLWLTLWLGAGLFAPTSTPSRGPSPALKFVALVVVGITAGLINLAGRECVWRPSSAQDEILRVARANPGRAYFPWNPLVTIISDGKVYPFDDALYCLSLAGLEPPPERIRAAAPAHPIIIYHEPVQSRFALRYFSERKAAP